MSLLTTQWQAPDTSFIGRLIAAGAEMRQRQQEAQQRQALAAEELRQRQDQYDTKLSFEREQNEQLARQFQVEHAFKVGKEKADQDQLARKNRIEDADNEPYGGGATGATGDVNAGATDAVNRSGIGPLINDNGGMDAEAPPSLSPSAALTAPETDWLGRPISTDPDTLPPMPPQDIDPAGDPANQAPAARLASAAPLPGLDPVGTPAPQLSPAPVASGLQEPKPIDGQGDGSLYNGDQIPATRPSARVAADPRTITGAMSIMDQTLRNAGVSKKEGQKAMAETARSLIVNANHPAYSASGALAGLGDVNSTPGATYRIGSAIWKNDANGMPHKLGVDQRVGATYAGPNGEAVVQMANGHFLVNGVETATPPSGFTRIAGAFDSQNLDLRKDVESRQADQGQQRIDESIRTSDIRSKERAIAEHDTRIAADRLEQERAQSDLEQLRKNPFLKPYIGKGDKGQDVYYRNGGVAFDEAKGRAAYDAAMAKYEEYRDKEDALIRRQNEAKASEMTAQKALDRLKQGVNPDKGQTPAAPVAPVPQPPAAPSNTGDVVAVASPAEADKLPPGTRFRTPDGRILIR